MRLVLYKWKGLKMKKILISILISTITFAGVVYSAELGVQEVKPNGEASTMDDLKTGSAVEADGFKLTPLSFDFEDSFGGYSKNYGSWDNRYYKSGEDVMTS